MTYEKFDVSKLERLNDAGRFQYLIPEVMWSALSDPDPRVIVDIGAGTGLFAHRFAAMAPHAEVYAVDTEPEMVRWMEVHMPVSDSARFHPLLGQETVVPIGTGQADLVVMINLHHELADPSATYGEALRVLGEGGQLLSADWAPGDEQGGPPQRVRVSADAISRMLSAVGFDGVTPHSGLPRHSLLTARKPAAGSSR